MSVTNFDDFECRLVVILHIQVRQSMFVFVSCTFYEIISLWWNIFRRIRTEAAHYVLTYTRSVLVCVVMANNAAYSIFVYSCCSFVLYMKIRKAQQFRPFRLYDAKCSTKENQTIFFVFFSNGCIIIIIIVYLTTLFTVCKCYIIGIVLQ